MYIIIIWMQRDNGVGHGIPLVNTIIILEYVLEYVLHYYTCTGTRVRIAILEYVLEYSTIPGLGG